MVGLAARPEVPQYFPTLPAHLGLQLGSVQQQCCQQEIPTASGILCFLRAAAEPGSSLMEACGPWGSGASRALSNLSCLK